MASQNQPPEDPNNEVDASDISDADEESNATVRRRVFSHLYLDDEYPPRPVVPIGPGFHAEIPKWEVTNTKNNYNSLESLKYSGTPVWPIEDGINEAPVGSIGQERHEFCSCDDFNLKLDLGPTFWTWKFDEMGEAVSRTWGNKGRTSARDAHKIKSAGQQGKLLGQGVECIPTKSKDSILSYYSNVFVPKRISMQFRS
ncbi:hypothetical protein ACJRO7_000989 [Eucalyptus globulus]|uniref:Uncharacterized protein n=1 Tax=Eucalyptus globulus TaxID=34317 RepID=A0ABD3LPH0_EUCGL